MATEAVPTTVTPEAAALAKEYGVERELEAILERGRQTIKGLRGFSIEAEYASDGEEPCVVIAAVIDPAFQDDPSHLAWWSWRFEAFGVHTGARFLVVTTAFGRGHVG